MLAALFGAAIVALPARPTLCDMATHEVAAAADAHHHVGPLGGVIDTQSTCAECDDMTGCCLVPGSALFGSAPEVPATREQGQEPGLAGEHLMSTPIVPLTPPPQA